jgi:hypothetical protein
MLTFATTAFSDGTWTITPDEPASLSLALIGFGAMVLYAALSGWRSRFTATPAINTRVQSKRAIDTLDRRVRRAA